MKIDKFIKRIEALAAVMASEEIKNRVSFVAVSRLAGLHKTRIFREGEATGGGKIGRYSTNPYYSNTTPKLLPKLSPLGKNGRSKFKNGKKKKTRYLPDGYSEFRKQTGRQNKTVDLNLTGATAGSLAIGRRAGRVVYGFTNQKAAEIMEGNEKRFKKEKEITKPTAAEIKAAGEAALNEFSTILLEIYGN